MAPGGAALLRQATASCVTTPLPSRCAAMPSNWPMVMTPVPPTPPTTMPQARLGVAATAVLAALAARSGCLAGLFWAFLSCPPLTVTKLGQKPLTQLKSLLQVLWLMRALAAKFGLQRLDAQAVGLLTAVAAAFAHQLVDHHPLIRLEPRCRACACGAFRWRTSGRK